MPNGRQEFVSFPHIKGSTWLNSDMSSDSQTARVWNTRRAVLDLDLHLLSESGGSQDKSSFSSQVRMSRADWAIGNARRMALRVFSSSGHAAKCIRGFPHIPSVNLASG